MNPLAELFVDIAKNRPGVAAVISTINVAMFAGFLVAVQTFPGRVAASAILALFLLLFVFSSALFFLRWRNGRTL